MKSLFLIGLYSLLCSINSALRYQATQNMLIVVIIEHTMFPENFFAISISVFHFSKDFILRWYHIVEEHKRNPKNVLLTANKTLDWISLLVFLWAFGRAINYSFWIHSFLRGMNAIVGVVSFSFFIRSCLLNENLWIRNNCYRKIHQ